METPLLFISMPQNGGEVIMHIFSIFILRHRPRYESTIVSIILNYRLFTLYDYSRIYNLPLETCNSGGPCCRAVYVQSSFGGKIC